MKTYFTFFIFLLHLYSYCQEEWQEVDPLPFQVHHTIGFSYNNLGYVVTGSTEELLTKSFYSYNPQTDTWTQKEDFPGLARSYSIGAFEGDKEYLGFGFGPYDTLGGLEYLNDLWSYHPDSDTWEQLADCPCDARLHPAFVPLNGNIYMGLGQGQGGEYKDWWQYNISANTWTQKTDFPSSERHHPYHFSVGDYVYVGFGDSEGNIHNDWYRYDPNSDTWEQMSSLPAEGRVAGTQFSHNEKGYVLSGAGEDHDSMEEGEFWQYDPINDQWNSMTFHPKQSRYAPGSFVIDNYVYLISGLYESSVLSDRVLKFMLPTDLTNTENLNKLDLNIYPNPFFSNVTIDLGTLTIENNFELEIYNTLNQLVYQTSTFKENMNLSLLEKGLFFIKITIDDKFYFKQIIKQ